MPFVKVSQQEARQVVAQNDSFAQAQIAELEGEFIEDSDLTRFLTINNFPLDSTLPRLVSTQIADNLFSFRPFFRQISNHPAIRQLSADWQTAKANNFSARQLQRAPDATNPILNNYDDPTNLYFATMLRVPQLADQWVVANTRQYARNTARLTTNLLNQIGEYQQIIIGGGPITLAYLQRDRWLGEQQLVINQADYPFQNWIAGRRIFLNSTSLVTNPFEAPLPTRGGTTTPIGDPRILNAVAPDALLNPADDLEVMCVEGNKVSYQTGRKFGLIGLTNYTMTAGVNQTFTGRTVDYDSIKLKPDYVEFAAQGPGTGNVQIFRTQNLVLATGINRPDFSTLSPNTQAFVNEIRQSFYAQVSRIKNRMASLYSQLTALRNSPDTPELSARKQDLTQELDSITLTMPPIITPDMSQTADTLWFGIWRDAPDKWPFAPVIKSTNNNAVIGSGDYANTERERNLGNGPSYAYPPGFSDSARVTQYAPGTSNAANYKAQARSRYADNFPAAKEGDVQFRNAKVTDIDPITTAQGETVGIRVTAQNGFRSIHRYAFLDIGVRTDVPDQIDGQPLITISDDTDSDYCRATPDQRLRVLGAAANLRATGEIGNVVDVFGIQENPVATWRTTPGASFDGLVTAKRQTNFDYVNNLLNAPSRPHPIPQVGIWMDDNQD